jgi:hypothetical protein
MVFLASTSVIRDTAALCEMFVAVHMLVSNITSTRTAGGNRPKAVGRTALQRFNGLAGIRGVHTTNQFRIELAYPEARAHKPNAHEQSVWTERFRLSIWTSEFARQEPSELICTISR